jgi:hypothetical protein
MSDNRIWILKFYIIYVFLFLGKLPIQKLGSDYILSGTTCSLQFMG